jgi:putative intracellular protease/amidase
MLRRWARTVSLFFLLTAPLGVHIDGDVIDVQSEGAWDDFYVVDGRVITGQNPQSAISTAKAVVNVFGKL